MQNSRRRQNFSDEMVQGELMFRVVIYWMCCLLTVALLVVAWSIHTGPPRPIRIVLQQSLIRYSPAIFGSVVLLPLVLLDVLRVSNRFVGPIQRLRNALRRVAAGDPVDPIRFRSNDYWQDMAFYFNQFLQAQYNPLAKSQPSPAANASSVHPMEHEPTQDYGRGDAEALTTAPAVGRQQR